MKGLIYKDLFSVMKYYRSYLILVVVFLAMSFMNKENLFFVFYPCLVTGMIVVSLIAVDEKEGWNTTCGFLPFSNRQLVGARYLTGLIFNGLFFLLTMAVQLARMLVMEGAVSVAELETIGGALIALGLMSPGIMLPFIYKFGPEKGRIVYTMVIGGVAGLTAFATTSGMVLDATANLPAVALALGAGVFYGLSFLVSVRICQGRKK